MFVGHDLCFILQTFYAIFIFILLYFMQLFLYFTLDYLYLYLTSLYATSSVALKSTPYLMLFGLVKEPVFEKHNSFKPPSF